MDSNGVEGDLGESSHFNQRDQCSHNVEKNTHQDCLHKMLRISAQGRKAWTH